VYPMTDIDEMSMFIGGVDGRAINELQAGEDIQAAVAEGDETGADEIAQSAGLFGETVITPGEEVFVGSYEVIVQHSSTDAMAPKVKADKYRAITMMLSELQPVLQQSGVQIDMGRIVRLWLEAEQIPGVESILSSAAPPQPDPAAGGGGAEQGALPAGADVPPDLAAILGGIGGAPGAPEAPITPDNSGALDPAAYPLGGQ